MVALNLAIFTAFALLATACASEITYSKADGNSYVGTGPDNYALTGSTLAEHNIKIVTVNEGTVTVTTLDGLTRSANLQSLSHGLREVIEDLRKKGSTHDNDTMFGPNLIADNIDRKLFRAKMSRDVPNHSTITMGQYIKSFAVPEFPDTLARIIVDDDVVSFVNYNLKVSMKPIAYLSESEQHMLEKNQATRTLTHISPWEVKALRRRLKKLHDIQNSGQEMYPDELSEQQWHEMAPTGLSDEEKKTLKQEELSSRVKLVEREVEVALRLQYEFHEKLEKDFQGLLRQTMDWERAQTEKYQMLKSKLETESDRRYNFQKDEYQKLKSNLETESDRRYNFQKDEYQKLKSNLETESDRRYNFQKDEYQKLKIKLETDSDRRYNSLKDQYKELKIKLETDSDRRYNSQKEQYQSLKSKLETESSARHSFHTEQYQKFKSEFDRSSNAWYNNQNEKYNLLKINLENDSSSRYKNSNERYERFKSDLERDTNTRYKLFVEQLQQLSSKVEKLGSDLRRQLNNN